MAGAVALQLLCGLRAVTREIDGWRKQAKTIPDKEIRIDALNALTLKRPHLDGAALFWTLPRKRNRSLLRLLVAYELILEFLDNVNERDADAGIENGRQLHLALIEALSPGTPISDYYRHHPWRDDGGYLTTLVETCRELCASLPSYSKTQTRAIREAVHAQVLALNHDPDPRLRDSALYDWVRDNFPEYITGRWFEISGAATAPLTIHMLFALAAEPQCSDADITEACAVYFPSLSLLATMLDSYVDREHDIESGNHRYVDHYPTLESAVGRMRELIARSLHDARSLRKGPRHTVIVTCMIAMYLSSDAAWRPQVRRTSQDLLDASGASTKLLLPILRIWRMAHSLRSA